jgi:hypothetical protein
LSRTGSAHSYETLLRAAQGLSDDELKALEDDLQYYAKTGLIGIYMSRLLAMLQPEDPALAA